MTKQQHGGPAFPRTGFCNDTGTEDGERAAAWTDPQPGMTVRAYVAANVLPAVVEVMLAKMLADMWADTTESERQLVIESCNEMAFDLADVFVAEMNK